MLARPHVLTLPIMVAWAAALVRAMDERASPPYWALPLIVLWANLHGSVALGLGLIGPAVLEALIEDWRAWPRILWRWLPFTALAVLAACLTPYGPGSLLVPLTTLGLGHALNTIVEWRPQDFGHFGTFEFLLLIGIFGALARGEGAADAHAGGAGLAAFRAGAGAQYRSAGDAGAALSGGATGAPIQGGA